MGLFDIFAGKGKSFSDLNRYVGDFEIVEAPDAKGRTRKRAVYTGVWTVLRDPSAAVRGRLYGALALSVALDAAYVCALLLPHAFAGQLIVMVPLLMGLFPALYLLMGALSLPFRGRPMRRDQYMHSFIRASRSAVAVGAFALAGMLASLAMRLVLGDWLFLSDDRRFLLFLALAMLLAAAVVFLLRGIDLTERRNDACSDGQGH